ncbi:MAG: hypothetical protein AAGH15_13960 [Myxococcota bacterium]
MASVLESLHEHLDDEATAIVEAADDLPALGAAPPAPFVSAKVVAQLEAAGAAVRGHALADDGAAVAWLRYRGRLYLARVEHRLRGALVGVYMQKVVYGIHGPE